MANATTLTLPDAIKRLYERRLLTRALPRLHHGKFARQARWNGHGSYEVRKWASLSIVTSTLTEGTTPNEHAGTSISTVTLTPDWYGAWVAYTDKLTLTSFDPAVSEIVALLGEQAGLSTDTIIRNTITDGATKQYSGGATTRATIDKTNDIIAFSDVIYAVATLEAANARPAMGSNFPVLVHPHTLATLMQDATFVTLFTREGGQVYRGGPLGVILNCELWVSSNVREYVDAGQNSVEDVYSMLFIGEESYAVGGLASLFPNLNVDGGGQRVLGGMTGQSVNAVNVIVKGLGETGFDPLDMRGTAGWKIAHADSILNSAWIVDLEHANDFS